MAVKRISTNTCRCKTGWVNEKQKISDWLFISEHGLKLFKNELTRRNCDLNEVFSGRRKLLLFLRLYTFIYQLFLKNGTSNQSTGSGENFPSTSKSPYTQIILLLLVQSKMDLIFLFYFWKSVNMLWTVG